jgi:hypothetical protein
MRKTRLFLLALLATALFSCKPDPTPTPVDPSDTIKPHPVNLKGVYVLNEGVYMSSNASLSFYDPVADTAASFLFYKANNAPIGDVGQSLAMAEGKLYIVVNNSNLIYKVDANTIRIDMTKPFKLLDFYSPREMHFVAPNKAYVSDLMGTGLWIVNPQDMSHCGFVETGKTTEKMVQVGNELYVSNWSYYYVNANSHESYNTVQVIDANNDVKVADIAVGKEPNTMTVDKNGHVWVLCEGRAWDVEHIDDPTICEEPSLWEIDPQLKTAQCRYVFEDFVDPQTGENMGYSASNMKSDPQGRYMYIIVSEMDEYGMSSDSEVRRFDVETLSFSESFCIPAEGKTFYNMAVDPNSGDLYISCIANPTVNGIVYRYTSDGVLLSSFEAGLFPSAMLFK